MTVGHSWRPLNRHTSATISDRVPSQTDYRVDPKLMKVEDVAP